MVTRVSAIIPNYNRADLIGETLDNMLRQSRPPDELIVVDDGSTDDSVRIIENFGDRVTLLRQPNSGPAVARNNGLDHATGEFIQFFDSDDLCSLNKLEAQAAALERSGADLAYGPWLKAKIEAGHAIYTEPPLQQRKLPVNASPLAWFLRGWAVVFQSCMFRRSFLERVGRYRPDLMPTEDSEFLFRILKAGARCIHVPEAILLYRVHGSQITTDAVGDARRRLDWLRYTEIVAGQLDGERKTVSRLDALRWRSAVWAAYRSAAEVPGGDSVSQEFGTSFSVTEAALFQAHTRMAQICAGVRGRLTGSRVPSFYEPGELTSEQKQLISAIGYVAMRYKIQERLLGS